MSRFPRGSDDLIIDVEPKQKRSRIKWLVLLIAILVFAIIEGLHIYVNSLWFESLGFNSVYLYVLKLKVTLFLIFAVATFLLLQLLFRLLTRALSSWLKDQPIVMINNQPVTISPERFIGPISFMVSIFLALVYGASMSARWETFALFLNRSETGALDPIFQKPVEFYFFTLPVYQAINSWFITLSVIALILTGLYTVIAAQQHLFKNLSVSSLWTMNYRALSIGLALFFICLAGSFYLSRFSFLWQDHQSFSGVTYTQANYLIPGLTVLSIALLISALVLILNALTEKRLRLVLLSLALPAGIYLIAILVIPSYIASFVVKPNELQREMPYIENNIKWTRKAFGLENVVQRDFQAEPTTAAFAIDQNREGLENIRLWDWRALQETLRQVQAIRTYYDFVDVDVDRYQVGGQTKQMMIAARELDVSKLPEQSRNWVNERLIYTHGYGVTMNTSNEFTSEGRPVFALSNMPVESRSPELKVTRPQIYFGQRTDTHVYVKTKQREFDYPQGQGDTYTRYEGTGGFEIGGALRRLVVAWSLGDLSKLPFSDDVVSDSRVLMHRNIMDRVTRIAPFLIYDEDPYIVVSNDGRLFWMMDAFTESATYPYSRHYWVKGNRINYLRNSVKVIVDAYNGTVSFYVFDTEDPLIRSYREIFPALFKDRQQMPADLRSHIRYPDTLIRTLADVYGLYHTTNPKVFFQREDVWSVARQVTVTEDRQQDSNLLDPYYVLMQLPGEEAKVEFVNIVPFTPGNRNNMIGWMGGRSDEAQYGSVLVYNFPESRLIDGPLQIEARIDQNAQLASQLTLWNQQGSRVRRGNLLVIPLGQGILYVEPIYLQAQRSPMPELRLVVVATQERLEFGNSFGEAMGKLLGQQAMEARKEAEKEPQAQRPGDQPRNETAGNLQELINRASQEFSDYQRLTAEGRLGEAGQKLEALRRTLEEMKR
jgi:uncharacterized protein